MTSKDLVILQEIIDAEGKCLDSKRCDQCPFKTKCLPEFLAIPMTQSQRFNMALNSISNHIILDESEVESSGKWGKYGEETY